jgi:cell division protein FtsZ
MGTGSASGEERAVLAAQQAISSPLLDNASVSGAQGVLVNITGSTDLTLIEVDQATSIIFEEAGNDANIIFGAVIDPSLKDEIMVTVIATGFNRKAIVDDFITEHTEYSNVKETKTQILSEKENLPLYEQSSAEQEKEDENKPVMLFDDSNPTVYGNDLEVPAFIRRQHE